MSLKFKDGTEYASTLGNTPNNVTVILDDYDQIKGLDDSVFKKSNLDSIEINGAIFKNYTTFTEQAFSVIRKGEKIHVTFSLRKKTEDEIAMEKEQAEIEQHQDSIDTALTYLTDQQALTVKGLCKKWDDDPDGYHYSMDNPADQRRKFGDNLWKLQKDHDKQASWYPGADPTLWVQIVEGHAGTLEDPIPVPDSVTTSGFEYVYGKYYTEGGTVYLCQRQGILNPEEMYGQTEKLYFAPSVLVGQYFVLAEELANEII